jgi:hypothetical protein
MTAVTWVPYCMDCDKQLSDSHTAIESHKCEEDSE